MEVTLQSFHSCILRSKQGIIDFTRTGTFAKEPKSVDTTKRYSGFSRMSVMANLLCFGRFVAGSLVKGCFLLTHFNIYI